MWSGELAILLLLLFGCADYIYFRQILTKQTRQLEPSVDPTRCQTASCQAKRQIEEGVVTETEDAEMNNNTTSLDMKVVEQIDRTIEGKPYEEEELKRKQDLLYRIMQSTITTSNVNHTLPDNTKITTSNFIETLLSEASKKINSYSTAKHQDSESDLGKKTVQKEFTPSVNEEEMVPSFTEIMVEERKLLTLPDQTTVYSQTVVPTEITETGQDIAQTIATSTAKEESKHQHANDELSSTENLQMFGTGKSVIPVKIVLVTETKDDSTPKEDLNHSFSYTDFTISKDVLNTTDNTSVNTVITKETDANLPHSTELFIDKQTTNEIIEETDSTSNEITESNHLNVNTTAKATPTVGKSNSKTNNKESSATTITEKIFSTSSVTTAPSKLNYITNKLETTQNTESVSKKTEQVDLFVNNEEITTLNLNQNSVENKVPNVSTTSVETHRTTKTIVSFDNAITVTPPENSAHELSGEVSKATSNSGVTSTSEVNQSSNTALGDVGEEENENSTRNEISQNSASNSYNSIDNTDKTDKNEVTSSKPVSSTNTVGITTPEP